MLTTQALPGAFASQRLIRPLSTDDPAADEDGAYAIALEVYARRVRRGEMPVGRKIGFTNRSIWAEYRVSAPIWGYVYDSTVRYARAGEARVAVGHLLQPRIEAEIQLHFVRTPPGTRDEQAILACIDWVAQGFEIVQCPFPDWHFRGCRHDRGLGSSRRARCRNASRCLRDRELRREAASLRGRTVARWCGTGARQSRWSRSVWISAGGSHDSGSISLANNTHSQRASRRSVFARLIRPRNAFACAGSTRRTSKPRALNSRHTNANRSSPRSRQPPACPAAASPSR
jgi:hypothetical protein